ncbi:hypothetical protein SAMN04488548_1342796 [Gordonia westfalica]|uniref:Uncharacterized protein n=1 Tax=Gordonia westfalica TaxID=158898 RepID=A0A1H2K401_9ACTN|nr:hypothetical protein SAMN04488548_1342796 [Gordonia westfalica]
MVASGVARQVMLNKVATTSKFRVAPTPLSTAIWWDLSIVRNSRQVMLVESGGGGTSEIGGSVEVVRGTVVDVGLR